MQLLVWLAYTAGLVAVVQGKAKGDRNVRRIELFAFNNLMLGCVADTWQHERHDRTNSPFTHTFHLRS